MPILYTSFPRYVKREHFRFKYISLVCRSCFVFARCHSYCTVKAFSVDIEGQVRHQKCVVVVRRTKIRKKPTPVIHPSIHLPQVIYLSPPSYKRFLTVWFESLSLTHMYEYYVPTSSPFLPCPSFLGTTQHGMAGQDRRKEKKRKDEEEGLSLSCTKGTQNSENPPFFSFCQFPYCTVGLYIMCKKGGNKDF